eukprot:7270952-Pyramimonas_sp.AAC.1
MEWAWRSRPRPAHRLLHVQHRLSKGGRQLGPASASNLDRVHDEALVRARRRLLQLRLVALALALVPAALGGLPH